MVDYKTTFPHPCNHQSTTPKFCVVQALCSPTVSTVTHIERKRDRS
jgi:hypothetical protein